MSDLAELLEGFTARAGVLGVRVSRVPDASAAAEEVRAIAEAWDANEVICSAELLAAAPDLASAVTVSGLPMVQCAGPDHARDARLGAALGHLALAETGSVLVNERTLADRSVGLLANGYVLLVASANLVPGLDQAAPMLRRYALEERGMATLITGPSRTADIERVLTVGVQGPARVAVIFVDTLA